MSKQIHLDIVTPGENFFSADIDMVITKTTEGDIGVLYNHEPTVAPLSIGAIKIKQGEEYKVAACAGGFINIEADNVTIVTDAAEWASHIDKNRASESEKRARERLDNKAEDINMVRARASLRRAINRLSILENYGGRD